MPGPPPPSPSKYNLLDPELSSPFGGADEVFYCFRQTHKLHKNKMDSKFNKSRQCSLKRSHIALTELITSCDQDLVLSRQKQILTGLPITEIYKNRARKISLFNYFMLGYISPITSLPHIYRRNSCPTHIFKPTHQTGLK